MNARVPASCVVGVVPWLPWPMSAWRWWTEPVRAERLAALRIGLAGCLLLDIWLTYLPNLAIFFTDDALGNRAVFDWLIHSPRTSWSLLRGFGDPLISFLAMSVWALASLWLLADLVTRLFQGGTGREEQPLRYTMPLWCVSGAVAVCGIWARLWPHADELQAAWIAPAVLSAYALFALLLELLRRAIHGGGGWRSLVMLGMALLSSAALLGAGVYLATQPQPETGSAWARFLGPWQDDPVLLHGCMLAWLGATACLLVGCCTPAAALATWVLTLSFANVNDSIDNAGDTVRGIILFYLMLTPCGAVWSVDRLWRRVRGKAPALVYVAPWALRLLFVQLVLIYFCNGVYKLFGERWRDGYSLYYVLSDFTLTRVSIAQLPLPLIVLRLMAWSVLAWEVSFPLLVVLHRWTRFVALVFGVFFHLGIFVSMELGFFVPYALCLYLPLVPWERWLGRPEPDAEDNGVDVSLVDGKASAVG